MRVFVTGATGYVGSAVAEALARAGHRVVALARSDESAQKLEAAGYEVHRGSMQDAASLAAGAAEADAVIHAATTNGPDQGAMDMASVRTYADALAGSGRVLIYTSGIWVLGPTGERVADEDAPVNPIPLVAWRPPVERAALDAAERGVRSVVLRPGMVYGRAGGVPGMFVHAARSKGAARYVGDGAQRWPFVDVDDLADLYVRALEAPPGTVLHATDGPALPVREVAEAAAAPWGAPAEPWPLEEARARLGPFADALMLDQQVSSERTRTLLGWTPRAASVLDDLRTGSYVADRS